MTDNPDMTYIPIEPPGPTAEELEAFAAYRRKGLSTYELLRLLYERACDQGKEELRRQYPDLFP